MTDYVEEQRNELEALESIYIDELKIISESNPVSFQITVVSQGEVNSYEENEDSATCVLQFTYTPNYPDEVPLIEIESSENLDDEHERKLIEQLKEQAEENLGMVMVFTLVSAAQETLHDLVLEMKQQRMDEEERKKREIEEAERKKFEGTHVTIETFLAWKKSFDEELAEKKKKKGFVDKNIGKLTGKELFMEDHTLDDSDVKFLQEEGGDSVTVDESLFQDMDDLDLDDEMLDTD